MKRIIPLKPWCRLGLQFFAVIAINLISLTAVKAQSGNPTVVISGVAPEVGTALFPVTITFSEPVTGFEQSDIVVINATLSSFTVDSSTVYRLDVNPTADGPMSLSIPAGAAQDADGNPNLVTTVTSTASIFSIGFELDNYSVVDGGTVSLTVTANRTLRAGESVNVPWVTFGDTARSGSDYILPRRSQDRTVVMTAGQSTATIDNIMIVANTPGEVDEQFAVRLTPPGNTSYDIGRRQTTVTIEDTLAPTVAAIERNSTTTPVSANGTTNSDSVAWAITFSEGVENVNASDFSLEGVVADLSVSPANDTQYLIEAFHSNLIDHNGPITLIFAAGQNIQDLAGNALSNTAPSGLNDNTFTLDNTPPTVTITDLAGMVFPPTVGLAQFTATITFSEDVTGFEQSDIVPGRARLANFNGSGSVYMVDVTPTAAGALTLTIGQGAATDLAGHPTPPIRVTSSVDLTAPTVVSVVRQSPTDATTNADSVSWRITFNKAVENVDVGDFSLSGTNATLTVSPDASRTELEVTASGGDLADLNAEITLGFAAGRDIQDAAGNLLTNTTPSGANDNSYTLDNTRPTVVIAGVASEVDAARLIPTITFSEPVTGFALSHINVTNATVVDLRPVPGATPGTTYLVNVTPDASGELTLSIPAGVVRDAAGNENEAADTVRSDATVIIVGFDSDNYVVVASTTAQTTVSLTVTANEANTENIDLPWGTFGLTARSRDDYISPSSDSTAILIAGQTSTTINVTILANTTGEGDEQFEVFLNPPIDLPFRTARGRDRTTITIQATDLAPTVSSIERLTPPEARTNADSVIWRITFNEAVENVNANDFSLTGTTAALTHRVLNDRVLGVAANGGDLADLNGQITLNFAPGQDIQDLAGNALTNTTPTGANETSYTLDNTDPTVVISGVASELDLTQFTATITFSEDVSGFEQTDIVPSRARLANFRGSGSVYMVDVTPTAAGELSLSIAAGAAQDSAGNASLAAATVTRTVVADTTIPVITLNGLASVNLEVGGSYTELNATASDNIDGDISANIVIGGDSVDTTTAGTYTITYNVSDSAATPNAAVEVTRVVTVTADTTIPVITLRGLDRVSLEVGGSYIEAGATASDNIDGDISANIVIGGDTVDTSMVGTYTITYNVSDSAPTPNAAVEVTRVVIVIPPDTTIPVIALTGPASVSLEVGSPYTEQGATATDNVDDNVVITGRIVIGGDSVDTSMVGTYTITYNVSDSATTPNAAVEVTREVIVTADTTIPVITLTGPATVNLVLGSTYTEQGATATDNIDGDISANIVIGGDTVDTSMVGTYTITYNVSDSAPTPNAAVEVTRTVTVIATVPAAITDLTAVAGDGEVTLSWTAPDDGGSPLTEYALVIIPDGRGMVPPTLSSGAATYTATGLTNGTLYAFALSATNAVGLGPIATVGATPVAAADMTIPVITLNGLATVNLVVGSPYNELNATALDNVDGDISANIVIGGDTVDTSMVGTYTITYNVSDSAPTPNAAVEVTREVIVSAADTTIPVITLNGLATVNLVLGSPYNELNATALDNVDGDISANIVIGGDSVDTSMVGTYTITYNVSDSAPTPNAAVEVTREVIVSAADTTIPVITLTGPATVNLEVGGSYTEAGATASDNVDGDISANIVIGGDSVDTSMVGTYTITYNVSDSATTPNAAVEVTREVIVTAAATVPAAVTNLTAVAGDREVTLSWTAPDDGGSPLTDYSLVITRPDGTVFVPPTLPSATATTHTVTGLTNGTTYTFFLIAGNAVGAGPLATDTATPVAPPDTTIPVITLNGLATVNLEVGGTYTELNATASDNVDGDISANIVIGGDSVDTTTAGTYRITYNVSDSATTPNAAVEVTRVVIVAADTTIPVITLTGPANISFEVGGSYTDAGATALDNIDGDITSAITTAGLVDLTRIGTYRITYNVSDSDGNAAVEVTRVVTVASAIPRANAGADQSVAPGVNVTLSGSGTDVKDDAAGTPLSYAWTLSSGTPAPSLSNAATATARFTAATVTSTVTYVFTLTVTDSDGNPASDTVTITVNSEVAITRDIDKQNKLILPSIARAMADQNVNAISTRISQAGEPNLKNSLGGKSNLVDILKSMERLNIDNSLNAEEALANSRFALALDGIEGAFWGKIDYQKFKGSDQGIKYDGDLFSSTVGVEAQINDQTRLGLALSRNKSDIDYTDSAPVLAATSAGDYEIVMFSVNPYIAWKWTDRVDLWATFGYGQGELELTLANSSRVRSSDISQKTLAVGGSGVLLDNGAIELRLKGEVVKTRFEVDKSEGIAALELDAERLRLGLEGTHGLSLADGASLNSSVEVGVRYDGGDGQTGSSGEIGGGLEYSNGRGLSLQGNARVLVGGDNYDEWGLGGLLKFQPSTDGRGVSFNLGLGHGNTASKTQDIWKHTLANNSNTTDNYTTTDINLGYGMTAPHWLGGSAYGILTPYTEVRLGNSNSYGLGLNWKLDPSVGLKLNFKHQSDSADSVNLEGEIHF